MFETSAIHDSPAAGPGPRRRRGAVPVIGLIGGVGAGKSAATAVLAARGATVIDADAVGHAVLERPEVRDRLVARFGVGIVAAAPDGAAPGIDRRALGRIVFADASARRDLEAIVHPRMTEDFERTIVEAEREGAAAVVLDAAVLLEAGWDRRCDLVVFVDAPRADRLRRVLETRGWTAAEFEAREAAQLSVDEKRARADYVLPNVGGADALAVEVDRFRAWLAAAPGFSTSCSTPPSTPRPGAAWNGR